MAGLLAPGIGPPGPGTRRFAPLPRRGRWGAALAFACAAGCVGGGGRGGGGLGAPLVPVYLFFGERVPLLRGGGKGGWEGGVCVGWRAVRNFEVLTTPTAEQGGHFASQAL